MAQHLSEQSTLTSNTKSLVLGLVNDLSEDAMAEDVARGRQLEAMRTEALLEAQERERARQAKIARELAEERARQVAAAAALDAISRELSGEVSGPVVDAPVAEARDKLSLSALEARLKVSEAAAEEAEFTHEALAPAPLTGAQMSMSEGSAAQGAQNYKISLGFVGFALLTVVLSVLVTVLALNSTDSEPEMVLSKVVYKAAPLASPVAEYGFVASVVPFKEDAQAEVKFKSVRKKRGAIKGRTKAGKGKGGRTFRGLDMSDNIFGSGKE